MPLSLSLFLARSFPLSRSVPLSFSLSLCLAAETCYGVASISRLLKITGLFCRTSSLLQGSFAKETYNFKEPTNRSHPIVSASLEAKACFLCLFSSPRLASKRKHALASRLQGRAERERERKRERKRENKREKETHSLHNPPSITTGTSLPRAFPLSLSLSLSLSALKPRHAFFFLSRKIKLQ